MEHETSYHHGDLRRVLVETALAAIRREGADGLTLRGIARVANVSHAAPYHHFKDKSALLAAVAEEGFTALRKSVEARCASVANPDMALQEAAVAYVAFAIENAHLFRLMFGAQLSDKSAHPTLQTTAAAAFQTIRGGVAQAGRGDVLDDSKRTLAVASWAMTHGLAMLLIDGQFGVTSIADAERITREATNVFWVGLAGHIEDPHTEAS